MSNYHTVNNCPMWDVMITFIWLDTPRSELPIVGKVRARGLSVLSLRLQPTNVWQASSSRSIPTVQYLSDINYVLYNCYKVNLIRARFRVHYKIGRPCFAYCSCLIATQDRPEDSICLKWYVVHLEDFHHLLHERDYRDLSFRDSNHSSTRFTLGFSSKTYLQFTTSWF